MWEIQFFHIRKMCNIFNISVEGLRQIKVLKKLM